MTGDGDVPRLAGQWGPDVVTRPLLQIWFRRALHHDHVERDRRDLNLRNRSAKRRRGGRRDGSWRARGRVAGSWKDPLKLGSKRLLVRALDEGGAEDHEEHEGQDHSTDAHQEPADGGDDAESRPRGVGWLCHGDGWTLVTRWRAGPRSPRCRSASVARRFPHWRRASPRTHHFEGCHSWPE